MVQIPDDLEVKKLKLFFFLKYSSWIINEYTAIISENQQNQLRLLNISLKVQS